MVLLGGQFKSATHGQFKSAQGGQFDGSSSHLGTVTHAETVSLSCAVVQNWLCHTFGA